MADEPEHRFCNRDRVSHETFGIGSVRCDPSSDDLVVDDDIEVIEDGVRWVYVVWDDDRFPVEKIRVVELELLSPGAGAISMGF